MSCTLIVLQGRAYLEGQRRCHNRGVGWADWYRTWINDGTFDRILERLQVRLNAEGLMDLGTWFADSTNVKASRAAAERLAVFRRVRDEIQARVEGDLMNGEAKT